jgi:hypothetical protein
MSELSQDEFNTLLEVQCEMVGTTLAQVNTSQPKWYTKYTWTQEQEEEFRDWAKRWLKKRKRWRSSVINLFIEYYLFNWGWKYENK